MQSSTATPAFLARLPLLGLALSLLLSGCALHQQSASMDSAQQQLAEQTVASVDWMQKSGEFNALSYQAFNTAEMAFTQAKTVPGRQKAVVVDLDETMIDNSAYAGWQIKHHQQFSDATWSQWTHARQAKALPGAVAFSHYVIEHGGRIFYVSNRNQADFDATVANLKALGFADVGPQTVLLKPAGGSSNKTERFSQVKKQGYHIVVYAGDNLNDFSGETYHKLNAQRRDFVNQHHEEFGHKYIVLPNPSYGDWQGGMARDYGPASAEKKVKIGEDNIDAWGGQ
ncbi:5'-nucleotidase, lipoprotein e(P4) family [Acerihabitans sp. TG2]|uniref:5'-nucleotidase, lipoprotein e(P4) family n=1 Tax=Acerihabitans sp. TG2 TaxID=3096008 RepID=UPI002B2333AD|nr:5'-nucleotidase, lipoprotein e(P4) family [Acerihabitans sp. TG2]MEA9390598.1 5'-nucleotidase, lipoprotein e(P4) family [Acerihabitans sp. TG2]